MSFRSKQYIQRYGSNTGANIVATANTNKLVSNARSANANNVLTVDESDSRRVCANLVKTANAKKPACYIKNVYQYWGNCRCKRSNCLGRATVSIEN